jgi:hypothetical protein
VNHEEAKAVTALKRLADEWPESLWIFTNGQRLYVMRNVDGKRVMNKSGGVDPDHTVAAINIPSDGGDW